MDSSVNLIQNTSTEIPRTMFDKISSKHPVAQSSWPIKVTITNTSLLDQENTSIHHLISGYQTLGFCRVVTLWKVRAEKSPRSIGVCQYPVTEGSFGMENRGYF